MTSALTPPAQVLDLLSRTVAASPADETAITWIERRRTTVSTRSAAPRPPAHERELQVRVLEAGRPGAFRPASVEPSELAASIRHAMAQARGAEPLSGTATLTPPAAPSDQPRDSDLFDPQLAGLDAEEGQQRLRDLAATGETARLAWCELAITVVTSRGLVRQARATSAALEVRCRRQPGSGFAAGAARTFARLDASGVFARARRRDGGDGPVGEWQAPAAVVLTAEATAALVAAIGRQLLGAAAWEDPGSFGRRHRGAAIAAPQISLLDDPAGPSGLPLPFSRTGAAATPAVLVDAGVLQAPFADPQWGARLGVPAAAPAWLGEPPCPEHLTLRPGSLAERELLLAAGDGVFVGDLESIEVWDAGRLAARLVARGVRRLVGGTLGEPLPDVAWEVTLPEALAVVRGIGSDTVAREEGESCLGAVSAPGIALAAAGAWRPL